MPRLPLFERDRGVVTAQQRILWLQNEGVIVGKSCCQPRKREQKWGGNSGFDTPDVGSYRVSCPFNHSRVSSHASAHPPRLPSSTCGLAQSLALPPSASAGARAAGGT